MLPAHTPYSGSSTPFTIGLRPLDLTRWLEVDARYEAELSQKDRLIGTVPATVFAAEDGTEAAQREVLGLVLAWLDDAMKAGRIDASICPAIRERIAGLEAKEEPPLQAAARIVQEDLVLMRRGEGGWRLAAASLCFPSSWSLAEKFGRPMRAIHGPVPGFGPGTRNADLIDRIFDRLIVAQPVERLNWSLQADDALHKPKSKFTGVEPADAARRHRFADEAAAARAFARVERQTLRKLPRSGDILFTIRIHLDPIAELARHPDRKVLSRSFADQLEALDDDQLAYKGLAADRDRLAAAIRALGA